MSQTIPGVVQDGKVIPRTPLPDGLQVRIVVPEAPGLLRCDADGVIRVGGTRVTLDTVVGAHRDGTTAEEIVRRYPALELADVEVAIGHYLEHREKIDAYLAEREAHAAMVRRQNEARSDPIGVRERLLARRRTEGKP